PLTDLVIGGSGNRVIDLEIESELEGHEFFNYAITRLPNYPILHMPSLELQSHTPWNDEHGTGHPLLLIPGLARSRRAWWKQIDPLSRRFRVINFDNHDAGDSEHATEPYSIGELAEDAAQTITALDLGPMHVMGWSMGTFIAQELTVRHPDLVNKLILVAGTAG